MLVQGWIVLLGSAMFELGLHVSYSKPAKPGVMHNMF